MNRPSALLLLASACGLLLVVAGLGCSGPTEPSCDARPQVDAVSLWTECGASPLSAGSVTVILSNGTAEAIWFYHECGDEVPWPDELQDDGTWLRLLPDNAFLPIICQHVMELAPGDSIELSMSTQHARLPGLYRAEMMVARGCVGVHEPLHVNHACDHVDFLVSEPFELR